VAPQVDTAIGPWPLLPPNPAQSTRFEAPWAFRLCHKATDTTNSNDVSVTARGIAQWQCAHPIGSEETSRMTSRHTKPPGAVSDPLDYPSNV
jgi:hypothetical protein